MSYLIAILVAALLLGGYFALTMVEASRGIRIGGMLRKRFDRSVGRTMFIVKHVDFGAFLRESIRDGIDRLLHDIAHGSLMIVRFLERVLTRFVRDKRIRREEEEVADKPTFMMRVRHAVHAVRHPIHIRTHHEEKKEK